MSTISIVMNVEDGDAQKGMRGFPKLEGMLVILQRSSFAFLHLQAIEDGTKLCFFVLQCEFRAVVL